MSLTDLRILSAALGFAIVLLRSERFPEKESGNDATAFAKQIEEFCLTKLLDVFVEEDKGGSEVAITRFAVARRMATSLAELHQETGRCLPHDLMPKGFTHDEIDRHWAMAKALAHVELKIMDT